VLLRSHRGHCIGVVDRANAVALGDARDGVAALARSEQGVGGLPDGGVRRHRGMAKFISGCRHAERSDSISLRSAARYEACSPVTMAWVFATSRTPPTPCP